MHDGNDGKFCFICNNSMCGRDDHIAIYKNSLTIPLSKDLLITTLIQIKTNPDLNLRQAKAIDQSIQAIHELEMVKQDLTDALSYPYCIRDILNKIN